MTARESIICQLVEGEVYIGSITNADGVGNHIILLPGDADKTWSEAMEWAKSLGGDLPSRVEQALLCANHAARLKKAWYWSNEDAGDGVAWSQDFHGGSQHFSYQYLRLRAVAVRRLPIQ